MSSSVIMSSSLIIRTRQCVKRSLFVIASVALATVCISSIGQAATLRILALGASNAAGKGVATEQAWPARLQQMLRAKGYDAVVTVNAVNGLTSSAILSGVDAAVAPGTQVVVFDVGMANDRKRNVSPSETQANKEQIAAHIRAHGAKAIFAPYRGAPRQADGHHLSAEGHAEVAARLVPMVIAAAGGRR